MRASGGGVVLGVLQSSDLSAVEEWFVAGVQDDHFGTSVTPVVSVRGDTETAVGFQLHVVHVDVDRLPGPETSRIGPDTSAALLRHPDELSDDLIAVPHLETRGLPAGVMVSTILNFDLSASEFGEVTCNVSNLHDYPPETRSWTTLMIKHV